MERSTTADLLISQAGLLEVAEDLARSAGDVLRARFERDWHRVATKSTPTDPVSDADHAAEDAMRAVLARRRPDDGILGEEGGGSPGTSGLRWVVDPLDGTVNFLFGIPHWAVSVACEDGGGTVTGVVFDPLRDELFAATRDSGPTCNGEPMSASGRGDLATALVATGFAYDARLRAAQAEVAARVLPRVRDLRRLGSAALDLAWTAAGRYDAFYERDLKRWDMAAGALLCARAGLDLIVLETTMTEPAGLLVAAPSIARELEGLVQNPQ